MEMEHFSFVMTFIGMANFLVIGALVFQAGGLVSRIKTLATDVEQMTVEVTNLRMKFVRLESIMEQQQRKLFSETGQSFGATE